MVGVPHLHPILKKAKRDSIKVDFGDCSASQVAGKSKAGAQRLTQSSTVATITCTVEGAADPCSFDVPWCVIGRGDV